MKMRGSRISFAGRRLYDNVTLEGGISKKWSEYIKKFQNVKIFLRPILSLRSTNGKSKKKSFSRKHCISEEKLTLCSSKFFYGGSCLHAKTLRILLLWVYRRHSLLVSSIFCGNTDMVCSLRAFYAFPDCPFTHNSLDGIPLTFWVFSSSASVFSLGTTDLEWKKVDSTVFPLAQHYYHDALNSMDTLEYRARKSLSGDTFYPYDAHTAWSFCCHTLLSRLVE